MIYCSNAFTRLWLQVFKNVASPRIILVEDQGDLVGVAPFASSHYSMLGMPIRVLALVGDVEYRLRLSGSSVLFPPERHDVLEKMVEEIKRLDWNKFTANNMQDSVAVREFIERLGMSGRQEEYLPGRMFRAPIPESGDVTRTFKKKARANTRNLLNRLERDRIAVEFKKIAKEGIDKAVDTYVKQHIDRWQTKGGSVFRFPENSEFVKGSMKMALSNRAGFAYELLLNGEVASQLFGFLDGSMSYGFRLGMDNKFARYSPGWIIHYFAFTDLQSKGITAYHTGLGSEDYKHWLGGSEMLLPGVKVNRGAASLLMRLARSQTFHKLDSTLGISKRALKVQSQSERAI